VAEACRRYGISRQTFYLYQRRLYGDGLAALTPMSRRPMSAPAQTAIEVEAEIVRMRTVNPRWRARTIHAHPHRTGAPSVPAVSTIHRVLQRNSLITPRAKRHAIPERRRFERYAPNDMSQIDGTQVVLTDGSAAWVVDILDDHARFAIGTTTTRRFIATLPDEPWRPPSSSMAHPAS
jgi:transposase-like protein